MTDMEMRLVLSGKRKYRVAFSAEEEVSGDVWLTYDQLRTAKYVLGLDGRWENEFRGYCVPEVELVEDEDLRKELDGISDLVDIYVEYCDNRNADDFGSTYGFKCRDKCFGHPAFQAAAEAFRNGDAQENGIVTKIVADICSELATHRQYSNDCVATIKGIYEQFPEYDGIPYIVEYCEKHKRSDLKEYLADKWLAEEEPDDEEP